MKTGIIYKATNKKNGKVYIGQTIKKLSYRIDKHCKSSRWGSNLHFHNAISKYGKDNFKWEVLHKDIPVNKLNDYEIFEIAYHDSYNNGYNSTHGGDENPMLNPESRKKNSQSQMGKKRGPKSEEHKAKIAISNRVYWSNKDKAKERNSKRDITYTKTEVFRQKISNGLKRYYENNECASKIIPDEEVIEIRRLFLNGMSTKDLAMRVGVSVYHIRGICNGNHRKEVNPLLEEVVQEKNKRKALKINLTVEEVLDMRRLRKTGLPIKDIAEKFDIPYKQAHRVITGARWKNLPSVEEVNV